jgi:uncharacterized membrane protein YedE/YeeE
MKRWQAYAGLLAVGVGIALVITLFSPWASSHPDGLEKVAEDKEFVHEAEDPGYEIIPDYQFPGVENERVATILAGIVGVLVVAAVMVGLGMVLARGRRDGPPEAAQGADGGRH